MNKFDNLETASDEEILKIFYFFMENELERLFSNEPEFRDRLKNLFKSRLIGKNKTNP